MNLNHLFDVRLAETDLMICETDSKGRDNPQLQRIMQVIMKDDAWRKKLTEKTLAFEKYYPVMVRSGFICMMVIPLVFLILMFSLESKLVYLILWIVSDVYKRQMLKLSRLDAGMVALKKEPFPVNRMLTEAIDHLEIFAELKGVKIRVCGMEEMCIRDRGTDPGRDRT